MQLDLNLLTALDMLLEEGSVGGAAFRLNLSEPAMSRTLGRLRRVTGDPILVRSGRFMTPTPYALRVREEVHGVVQQAKALLHPSEALDLTRLERTFTVRGHDTLLEAVAPPLLRSLRQAAPGIRLRFLSEQQGQGNEDVTDLRQGDTDLALGSSSPQVPDLLCEVLGHDRLVVALRRGHPLLKGTLTAARYAAARHISVSRRGRFHGPLDATLAELGLMREVEISLPTSTAALQVAASSDLLATVPERMSAAVLKGLGLSTRLLPISTGPVPALMTWHCRTDVDAASRWFRAQVRAAAARLLADGHEQSETVVLL